MKIDEVKVRHWKSTDCHLVPSITSQETGVKSTASCLEYVWCIHTKTWVNRVFTNSICCLWLKDGLYKDLSKHVLCVWYCVWEKKLKVCSIDLSIYLLDGNCVEVVVDIAVDIVTFNIKLKI